MSLKRNILASYAGQAYVTAIGIVMVPVYVRYMGTEAYGLVGVFGMLQAWFQMLDMGLSPTLSRQAARVTAEKTSSDEFRGLLRALEILFVVTGGLGASALAVGAGFIASEWLKVEHLPLTEVQTAIELMALSIGLRWWSGLYRGAIAGFERQVWLAGFNVFIATVRFIAVLPLFVFVGTDPTHFFVFQAVVAILELAGLVAKTYGIIPGGNWSACMAMRPSWGALRRVGSFALGLSVTNVIWVLVTQSDRFILSKLLPLTEYAHFTIVVLVASGIQIASAPLGGALMPRLSGLSAVGNRAQLSRVYRAATRLSLGVVGPITLTLAVFPEQALFVWTGDPHISSLAGEPLRYYAIGNALLALVALAYYLQFAEGKLRLHVWGNAIFVALFLPAVLYLASRFGAVGAGYAWASTTLLYFLFWVPVIHRRFVPGMHARWLVEDVAGMLVLPSFVAFAITVFLQWSPVRWVQGAQLVGTACAIVAAAGLGWWLLRHFEQHAAREPNRPHARGALEPLQ